MRKYDKDTTKYIELSTQRDNYESLACEILLLCDDLDSIMAQQLLMRKINEFSHRTPIQIAIAANDMNFISSPTFRLLTQNILHGKIVPGNMFFILICLFFPFLVPSLLHFRDKSPDNNEEENDNKEEVDDVEENDKFGDSTFKPNTDFNYPLDFFNSGEDLSGLDRIYHYFRSPIVKFFYYSMSNWIFLMLFSYVMLCDFYPIYQSGVSSPSGIEIYLIIFV